VPGEGESRKGKGEGAWMGRRGGGRDLTHPEILPWRPLCLAEIINVSISPLLSAIQVKQMDKLVFGGSIASFVRRSLIVVRMAACFTVRT